MLLRNQMFLATVVDDYQDWGSETAWKDYCSRFGNRYIWIQSVTNPSVEEIDMILSLTDCRVVILTASTERDSVSVHICGGSSHKPQIIYGCKKSELSLLN